jgi:transcriptional regulator with XRE-family HTH domain
VVDSETPAGARRRLRVALRRQREEAGLTQSQVAEALDWSLSKVQRIEAGEVSMSSSDLKASLALYGITDTEQINKLVAVARATRPRRSGWWDEPRYRPHMSQAFRELLQFEREAAEIRVYNPSLVPGVLQVPAYARAIFDFWVEEGELTPEGRDVRLEMRMRRREFFLDHSSSVRYFLVLDESVLRRSVGGPKVMYEQLNDLSSLIRQEKIKVRIVPFDRQAPASMLNHFSIYRLAEVNDPILYQEAQMADSIEPSPRMVELYSKRFERLWDIGLREEATASLIEAETAAKRAMLARETRDV